MSLDDLRSIVSKYIRELENLWGFNIDEPEIVVVNSKPDYDEDLKNWKVNYYQPNVEEWGVELVKAAKQDSKAGEIFWWGHSLGHFFAYMASDQTLKMGGDDGIKIDSGGALTGVVRLESMEAVANYSAKWLLNEYGYLGDLIVEKYYEKWSKKNQQIASNSKKIYDSFKSRDDCMNFVKKYPISDSRYEELVSGSAIFKP
jgi:hypothetical protein